MSLLKCVFLTCESNKCLPNVTPSKINCTIIEITQEFSAFNHLLVLPLNLSQVWCQSVLKRMRKGTCASLPTPSTASQGTWKTKIHPQTASPRARCWNGATRSSPPCSWKTTTTAKKELDTAVKKTRSSGESACPSTLMFSLTRR